MIMLGVLTVYFFMKPRVKKYGMDGDGLSNLIFIAFIAAFAGGKILYYLQSPSTYIEDPSRMLDNLGNGFVFYGSLIATIPVILILLKRKGIPLKEFLDILAFVGPIVHSFGRMGCFLAGCCYGKVCQSGFGITFTNSLSKAPLNKALHPTQLYDILVNILILVTLFYLEKKKAFNGQLFLIYIVMYAVGRSIVEIYRGDEERGFIIGQLSYSQFIAILLSGAAAIAWMQWRKKPKS